MRNWLKITLKILAGLITVVIVLIIGATLYVSYHKDQFLKLINAQLSENVDGIVLIGDMHPQFFKAFPNISLGLDQVVLRDKRFAQHHHTLLNAKNFNVSIDIVQLIKGNMIINRIDVSNAAIDFYTDSTGYSNTAMFKSGDKKTTGKADHDRKTSINKFSFNNVNFIVEDQRAKKRFDFLINNLNGDMKQPSTGREIKFHLDVLAKSMAFSTDRGSFIKDKTLVGDFAAKFDVKTGDIVVNTDELKIGSDPFKINAVFAVNKPSPSFLFHISCKELLWRNASALLAHNITSKLNMFNMSKPIDVKATISGNFNGGGDPYLYITAGVKNNTVTIPGSMIENCSFEGVFTNSYQKSKPFGDPNSIIKLSNLSGTFHQIPFKIDTGSIINLVDPIATGNFISNFPLAKLNGVVDSKTARFNGGGVNINLRYRADIVNFRLHKPIIAGKIQVKNAEIRYVPKNLTLKNTSLSLNFIKNDLILNNISVQTGRSVMMMDGRVNNFLNLYYNSPEKILLTWNIHSPQMYLGEFIGFLNAGTEPQAAAKRPANSSNIMKQLSNVLDRGTAKMHITVTNAHYNKFLATNVKADLLTTANAIVVQNVGLQTAGGSLQLSGRVQKLNKQSRITLNTTINNVNVRNFFEAFDNFGLKDFTYANLKGTLSAKTQFSVNINNRAEVSPRSFDGNVDISLKNAALLNFKPLLGIGKYAFPFRDLKNISVPLLNANFVITGDKIQISPMQFSSSVLNADIEGVYGLNSGTNIALDIPLRNPKGDSTLTDKAALQKRRFRGIVLHLLAKSDESGKIKIGLNKNHKDTK